MVELLLLSRLQFAITVAFHFLFVPLTLGLALLVAGMETIYYKNKDETWRRMADFWGRVFKINFAIGLVTGLAMTFQFGTNWGAYAEFMGDVFGPPLAVEALLAFFLEGTFFGAWIFLDRSRQKLKAFSMWMVALGTNISSLWIITANGFMQNPVGYEMAADGSKVVMTDFFALLTNSYVWYMLIHTLLSAYLLTAFLIMGICAYHFLKRNNNEVFRKSFRIAVAIALITAVLLPVLGHGYAQYVAELQPAKGAAMDAVWETGSRVPMYLIQVPDSSTGSNSVQLLEIPGLASFLYTGSFNGTITGLNQLAQDELPPVGMVFWSFRLMTILGSLFIIEALLGLYLQKSGKLYTSDKYLKLLMWSIPLPYIAITAGWIVAEVGRQPWIVYGLLKTANGISSVPISDVLLSIVLISAFYLILMVFEIYLIKKTVVNATGAE
ncbi:Cytochrome d ubiquinol oxidase subunit I [Methanosarcina horonobensis HB-1 = JCM 15518]|uniref:Cytochrome d ubiquinol oxidase subunit I n=1 Tax=Methanosarcina horonobensis HB-1 = JCM 15518 TaxID=1434110 RepID=A0A0E3SH06_9EURY|nr:cytochrome ubiquinol oxidase subunit I [Methanosarcina horonobensis]AKB78943.1 Cytochrome d ubiquinol oxidase subunit I [Methanosarcina horonobensis HB-1 = JCM 15518]